jgi:pimeloyl-ACP methyl ester carboxylesterase
MPNPTAPNRNLHASYEIIGKNLNGGAFTATGIAAADLEVITRNGYAIDRIFNDPVTDFQAVGLIAIAPTDPPTNPPPIDPTRPPLLVFTGTSTPLDEDDNRNRLGVGFAQFTQNRADLETWLRAIATDATKNPQRLLPDLTGHSYGGAIGQLTAAAFPTLMSEIVTFNSFGLNTGIGATFQQNGGVVAQVTHYINSGDIVSLQGIEFLPGAAVLATYTTPAIDPQNYGDKHFAFIAPNSTVTQPANITYQEIGTTALNSATFTYIDRDWQDFTRAIGQTDPQLAPRLSSRQTAESLRTELSYFQLVARINQGDLLAGYTAAGGTGTGLSLTPASNVIAVNSTTPTQTVQFTSVSRTNGLNNEIGLFRVDDAAGSVGGILPGAAGYLQAALGRSQVVFSNLSGNFFDANSQRKISFTAGDRFQLYSVQNSTTDQARQNLASGQAAPSILFANPTANGGGVFTSITPNGTTGASLNVGWNNGTNPTGTYQDLVIRVEQITTPAPVGTGLQGTGELIDLRATTGTVQVSTTIRSDASYNNSIGLYRVDNEAGGIDTLNPSDAGYAAAALRRAVLTLNKTQTTATQQISGGALYGTFMVANGTVQDFLTTNATNAGGANVPHAYFNYVGANPDGVDHVRLLGDNKFGFEDFLGGGDRDYNDTVVQFNIG